MLRLLSLRLSHCSHSWLLLRALPRQLRLMLQRLLLMLPLLQRQLVMLLQLRPLRMQLQR